MEKTITRRHFIAASVAAVGGLALFGCSSGAQGASSSASPAVSSAASSSAADLAQSSSAAAASSAQASSQPSSQPTSQSSSPAPSAESAGDKVLVACFSATGNTRAVAMAAAAHLGADYFEIEAAVPYTDEDLNYNDEATRATTEQNDPAARPAIAAAPDFSAYDTVLLGHPIWWGKAPRLICTLLEGADLAGKKVAEFCTSGSSGIEGATGELEALAPGAEWVGARRFAGGAPESEVAEWVDSLALA